MGDDYDTQHALDIRVALEVMGWTRYVSADHTNSKNAFLRKVGIVYAYRGQDGRDVGLDVPPWSTDLTTAKSVIERMAELGYWCEMRTPFEKTDKSDYWAGFTPHSTTGWNGRPDHWTQAETLEQAICLAALKAVGVE